MSDQRWVLVHETDGGPPSEPVGKAIVVGESLLVGREGDLPLGVEVEDRGISRKAVQITATEHGWLVEVGNRNGAMVHPWGQCPIPARRLDALAWPRIAIRVLNGSELDTTDSRRHWVLLEADMIAPTLAGARESTTSTTSTDQASALGPLTSQQRAALTFVFADHLQWPPALPAEVRTLEAAGRALHISASAVQSRLGGAIKRAVRLGLPHQVGSTNPEYLYTLVRTGHLPLPRPAARSCTSD
ncbi:MAG: hypothetical protein L0K86_20335 [Actinomycetia bacterium]|nr:hypothetical protein [Actinomycetes bacterium]